MATSLFKKNFPGVEALQSAVDDAAFVIGLDLHKKTTAVCVVDPRHPDTPVFRKGRLQNADLLATIGRFAGKKVVACEAAFGWHRLAQALEGVPDVAFIPLDARKTASWIKTSGIKNDKIDAEVLCVVCLCGGISRLAVYRTSERSYECSKLIRYRDHLVRQAASVKRQLRSFDQEYRPNPYTGEVRGRSAIVSLMEGDLHSSLANLETRIASLEEHMEEESKGDAVLPLLRSIPGIGFVTAFALRHMVDDIRRFASPAHLSSYTGFGIRQRQSGDHRIQGKIAKTGNALLRRLLVQGAQIVRARKPELVPLYFPAFGQETLMAGRTHRNKVVVAIARKNLTFAWNVWMKAETFDLEGYRRRREEHTSSPAGDEARGCLKHAATVALPSPCVMPSFGG